METVTRFGRPSWTEITDPDGVQRSLFVASRPVYNRLFSPEHRERWLDFREYIRDTQRRLKVDSETEPRDYYLVGSTNGRVCGIAFLTSYPSKHLAFMAYFGVLQRGTIKSRHLARSGILYIRRLLENEIEAILFEVEKIAPERMRRPDAWTRDRLLVLENFQRFGARKIMWLVYEQPLRDRTDLGDDTPRITNLHLMLLPTSRISRPKTLSRLQVERYVSFLYNTYCLDGFIVTDPERTSEAANKLTTMTMRVMSTVPRGLNEVPLGQVALKPASVKVFISHTSGGGLSAEVMADYLMDMGIPVVYWEKDAPDKVGAELHTTILRWIKNSDVVVGLVTEAATESFGMVEELVYARDLNKRIIVLMSRDMLRETYRKLEEKIKNLLGNLIYLPFEETTFHQVVARVAEVVGGAR